jgi:hypothetical protein
MITIDRVIRNNGRVLKVVVIFDKLEITFERTKDGVKETSRTLWGADRMTDREKLWIPDYWYKKMWRQVMAIFN